MGNRDSKPPIKRGICPKCRRYQLLKTSEGTCICSLCGHIWKINKSE